MRLRPRDLLRIGTLVLANGQSEDQWKGQSDGRPEGQWKGQWDGQWKGEWDGRQIVSGGWLVSATRPAIPTGHGLEYGRLWWLGEAETPALIGPRRWIAGFGNGGQRLWLMPDVRLAAAVLCGHYNAPDSQVTPARIWREIVLANLLHV